MGQNLNPSLLNLIKSDQNGIESTSPQLERNRISYWDKIRPKWDWKKTDTSDTSLKEKLIKSDQNGIESIDKFIGEVVEGDG